ncbi:MAG: GNAT family N-acetyltransferase [Planctomycetes bacterium]|nr:GNAT family N-acetyltransferase [Planctomycetota bacterium]
MASQDSSGDAFVDSVTWYLEMRRPPAGPALEPPRPDVRIEPVPSMDVAEYRELYRAVGEKWGWFDRTWMSDAELSAAIHSSGVEIHVLYVGDARAGYFELDFSQLGECQLVYFGLAEGFLGMGLGAYLMDRAARRGFSRGVARLWVHTCDRDSPRALPAYERAGFRRYDEKVERVRARAAWPEL